MVVKTAFFTIFGDIRILQIFYNSLIIQKIIGFCCIEGEIGVLSDLMRIVMKRRFLFNS